MVYELLLSCSSGVVPPCVLVVSYHTVVLIPPLLFLISDFARRRLSHHTYFAPCNFALIPPFGSLAGYLHQLVHTLERLWSLSASLYVCSPLSSHFYLTVHHHFSLYVSVNARIRFTTVQYFLLSQYRHARPTRLSVEDGFLSVNCVRVLSIKRTIVCTVCTLFFHVREMKIK